MGAFRKCSLGCRNVKRVAHASIRATAGVRSAVGAGDSQGVGGTGAARLAGSVFEWQFSFRASLAVRCTRVVFAKLAVRASSLRWAAWQAGVRRRLTTHSSGRAARAAKFGRYIPRGEHGKPRRQ